MSPAKTRAARTTTTPTAVASSFNPIYDRTCPSTNAVRNTAAAKVGQCRNTPSTKHNASMASIFFTDTLVYCSKKPDKPPRQQYHELIENARNNARTKTFYEIKDFIRETKKILLRHLKRRPQTRSPFMMPP